MREIHVQELSEEKFKKYGAFQNLLDTKSLSENSISTGGFFPDVIWMDYGKGNPPTVSLCHVTKKERNIISFVEAHQYTCEGLLPLDADVVIYVGILRQDFQLDTIEAFRIPKGTFVKLNPLIVHGTQYVNDQEEAHIACFLPGRTFRNDMIAKRLEESEQIKVLL